LLRLFDNSRVYAVRRIILVIVGAVFLSGCSPADPLNLLAWRHGIEITRSVAYGASPRQTLDVYRPAASAKSPVVVFFYGGSWQTGDKESQLFVAIALAQRGYVVVVPDYRVYPEVRYPDFVRDGARAVRWAKDNAARFGGDPGKLFVMGHSAGAYIAAMLVLDSRWLQEAGLTPNRDVAGLIGISGPYDFLPLHGTLATIFGGSNVTDTQPISHVAPGAPPAFLATGQRDRIVEPSNTTRLAARLAASGDKAVVKTYPWVGHITIIGSFAPPLRFLSHVLDDVDQFMAAQ
jgi:acetyl esterase/lipase